MDEPAAVARRPADDNPNVPGALCNTLQVRAELTDLDETVMVAGEAVLQLASEPLAATWRRPRSAPPCLTHYQPTGRPGDLDDAVTVLEGAAGAAAADPAEASGNRANDLRRDRDQPSICGAAQTATP